MEAFSRIYRNQVYSVASSNMLYEMEYSRQNDQKIFGGSSLDRSISGVIYTSDLHSTLKANSSNSWTLDAMFPENPAVENTLATIGAVLWMILILPQIEKSYRTKDTTGLSPHLLTLWALSAVFFATYAVAVKLSIPLTMEPHAMGALCILAWGQCMYYNRGMKVSEVSMYVIGLYIAFASFEVTSVFTLFYSEEHGTKVPTVFYGSFNTVLTVLGFIPQYYEIYRLKEVRGISLISLTIDILGGVLSALSLFFRPSIDIIALATYMVCVFLDIGIIGLYIILKPFAERRRKREAMEAASKDIEDGDAETPGLEERGDLLDGVDGLGSPASGGTVTVTGNRHKQSQQVSSPRNRPSGLLGQGSSPV